MRLPSIILAMTGCSLGCAAAADAAPPSPSVFGGAGLLLRTILSPSCLHPLDALFPPPPMLQVFDS